MIPSSRRRVSRPRRTFAVVAALVAVALLATACTDDGSDAAPDAEGSDGRGPVITVPTVPFTLLDEQLSERVARAGLGGATLIVEQDGTELHRFVTGAATTDTPLALAETGMWLTAATLMTLVDDGLVSLDEPVGTRLTFMADGPSGEITLRQLLSQTSGLPREAECATVTECDEVIAVTPLLGEPGSVFAVSAVGYHVAARLAEEVTGKPWADLVRERLFDPLDMGATRFRPPGETSPGPANDPDAGLLAADGETTSDDLGRFLRMILARGAAPDGQLIEVSSVEEMERDQTPNLDTSDEAWVAATGIPTYGLGVWRDRLRGDGTALASMVSAPNRFGVYPLVDRTRNAWAVIAVDDDPLAPFQAVRDSAAVAQLMAAAIDTDGRAIRRPGSTIPR